MSDDREAECDAADVKSHQRRRYTLAELLAQCNPDAPLTEDDRMWLSAPAVGRELI